MSALPLRVPLHDAEKAAQAKPLTVAVTGGSGYVGSVLVKRLLVSGHTVHATVRDPSNERKVKHLTALPGAAERLKLFKADLLDKDTSAFEAAFAGCSIVLHTASPFSLTVKPSEVQDKLVRPAVSGVELALGAASKTASVETVVMTSSVVAVWGNSWEHGKDHVITEADWDASANEKWLPYSCSKTLAERRAWELEAAQTGPKRWRLATILPGFVMGPPVSLVPSESVDFCKSMLNGEFKMAFPPMG